MPRLPRASCPSCAKIAARGSDPLLAYATDEDAGLFGDPFELDPMVNRFDLGSDPLKYYAHRVQLAQELFEKAEGTLLKDGAGYQVLRRSFMQGFGSASYSLYMTSKYIGGIRHNRDHVGDPNGRLPLEPVGAAEQRAALELLKAHLFAPEAFAFSPALLRKLSVPRYPDFTNWESMINSRKDVPVHTMVLELQTDVLDRLLHPVLLARLLDMDLLLDRDAERFKVSTLLAGLQDAIWQDAKPAAGPLAINSHRRALQRAHIQRLAALVGPRQQGAGRSAQPRARGAGAPAGAAAAARGPCAVGFDGGNARAPGRFAGDDRPGAEACGPAHGVVTRKGTGTHAGDWHPHGTRVPVPFAAQPHKGTGTGVA